MRWGGEEGVEWKGGNKIKATNTHIILVTDLVV